MQNHLAKFADLKTDKIRDVFEPTTYIIWDGVGSYNSQVQAAIAAQAQRITWMVSALVSNKVLSEEERSALRLVIQVQQEDRRKGGGDPLPPVHDVPVALP